MKIAFYSPLKSPDHPVPSGDRLMARLLVAALGKAGHEVEVISQFRSFIRQPTGGQLAALELEAAAEAARIGAEWRKRSAADLWFTYHPYYKAPDLLGPSLARDFAIPYVTAEASYSGRRNIGDWADAQQRVLASVRQAFVNICLTRRDRDGLVEAWPAARTALLAPFLDAGEFLKRPPRPKPGRLVTVAMMRPGDKMESYAMLAQSLALIGDRDWTLSIIGDGPCRSETEALFAGFSAGRIVWHGQQSQAEIASLLAESAVYVWPGCGEAYGLAYLEAQAAGLPVVAQAIAGVPEVVDHGRTGLLTPAGDMNAYACSIESLLDDAALCGRLAAAARAFVQDERSLDGAALRLDGLLKPKARG
jgi:glycosyltransferase involved in cell wall biosynthesis